MPPEFQYLENMQALAKRHAELELRNQWDVLRVLFVGSRPFRLTESGDIQLVEEPKAGA